MATHFFFFLLSLLMLQTPTGATAGFNSILVFGDSTVDTGNNNYIPTLIRADHRPYGLNFIDHSPTGRFSDGRLVPDLLAARLGIKETVPPFLDPRLSDEDLLTGVNFASAGAGLDDLTMAALGVIPMSQQPRMFEQYLQRLRGVVGEGDAASIVGDALILISAGNNDFLFNYYPMPARRLQFNVSEYQDFLLKKMHTVIKEIYDLGGRKFIVAGFVPMGCMPFQRNTMTNLQSHSCEEDRNSNAQLFNSKLKKLLRRIQTSLPPSRLAYGNIYDPVLDMINNPHKYGFEETKRGCCGGGVMETGPLCNALNGACEDVSKYMFWDAVHPTQSAYEILVSYFLKDVVPSLLK